MDFVMKNTYNDNCILQKNTICSNLDLVQKCIDILINNGTCQESLKIVNFGCAHGRSSQPTLTTMISKYLKKHPHNEIMVYQNDLPTNNFSLLLSEIQGNPQSYIYLSPNVYTMCIGQSFYQQTLPNNTVHIAMGFNCFHWGTPSKILPEGSITMAHKRSKFPKYIKECQNDLLSNVLNRSKELANGGIFIMNLLTDDKESFKDTLDFYVAVKLIWIKMYEECIISKEEAEEMALPWRYYSLGDIKHILKDQKIKNSGMKLKSYEFRQNRCPYEPLIQSHGLEYFAEKFVSAFHAFSEPTFKSILKCDDAKKEQIWEIYNQHLYNLCLKNPSICRIPNNYYITIFEKIEINIE
ncbi:hypothetical protein CYY_006630 [Polysphondylium violaceum]|uniref:SAM dependent carboxyl methyltransferase n=1 Tax=Polysphondylium violaceum TaxID=133409 RepID=A0A8J4PT59_9MYCE|nr:hypothetical protein CYY_006630 [Polysphondylium violaceum]